MKNDDALLQELRTLNANLEKQHRLLEQSDWKLWVITNAICDAMLKQQILEKDPRQP